MDIAFHVAAEDIPNLEANSDTQVLTGPSYAFTMIQFNTQKFDTFEDVRVRQAFAEALDVQGIVTSVFGDTATVADSFYSPMIIGHKAVGPVKYDPDHAKQLLEEANFDFSQTIEYTVEENRDLMNIAEIAQNMWAAIGVNVEVKVVDSSTRMALTVDPGLQITSYTTNASSADPDHGMYNWASGTSGIHDDPKIWELIEKGKTTYDEAERIKVYEELQQACWDFYGMIPIAYTNTLYGIRGNVQNFAADPGYIPDLTKVTFQ